jgi:hypothetical protein
VLQCQLFLRAVIYALVRLLPFPDVFANGR